jgi:hypothetical protein
MEGGCKKPFRLTGFLGVSSFKASPGFVLADKLISGKITSQPTNLKTCKPVQPYNPAITQTLIPWIPH